jgi:anti-sigma28 factor (negative regulator of flagellin synthesis)
MSDKGHRSTPERAMFYSARESNVHQGRTGELAQSSPGESERLHVIHELVRSGDYHVPASAIADCIIERMMVDKRGQES